jgi:ABC-2 type transport system ATP-binding protein
VTTAASDRAVSVTGLTKTFGSRTAVDGITVDVGAGEVFGLVGPNGAGKTTFIRMLCGLFTPNGGSGTVLGYDIERDAARIRERVGYMSQGSGLYDELTVDENIRFFADVYGVRDTGYIAAVRARLGLDPVRHTMAAALPTGLRQRTSLAAALVHHPQLVVLDEPTSGVDPVARDGMWRLVRELADEGVTALVTTHVMPEAERCDRLALLAGGRLVAVGSPAEVIERSGLTIARIVASPWQDAFARLKARWPEATLHGTSVHIPVAGHGAEERDLRSALTGVEVGSLTWQRPTMEDAFIALVTAGA